MNDDKRLQYAVLLTGVADVTVTFHMEYDNATEKRAAIRQALERFGEAYADAAFATNRGETASAYADI